MIRGVNMVCDNCSSKFTSIKFLTCLGKDNKVRLCDKCLVEVLEGRKQVLKNEIELIEKKIKRIKDEK